MTGHDHESKRGRVRRLLIDPLDDIGFRKHGNVKVEKHKANLARVADELSYMTDAGLETLRGQLKSKGQGPSRDVWPSIATITAFAELVEPKPIEEMPELLRWFRSRAGPAARDAGTLVETYGFFHRFKKPPVMAERQILERAQDNRRKLELYEDRIRRDVARPEEVSWARGYRERLAYCEDLVRRGEEYRAKEEQKGDAA